MRTMTRTMCTYGHPYTPENLYTNPSGQRQCRTCNARRSKKHRGTLTDWTEKPQRATKNRTLNQRAPWKAISNNYWINYAYNIATGRTLETK